MEVAGQVEDAEGGVVFGEEGESDFEFEFLGDLVLVFFAFGDVVPDALAGGLGFGLADCVKVESAVGEDWGGLVVEDQVAPLESFHFHGGAGVAPHFF